MSTPVAAKKPAATPKAKKAAAPAAHPPYKSMIKKAVSDLKEKGGSSRAAIVKYITEHYKVKADKNAVLVKQNLKRMIAKKELVHASSKSHGANGSFKLPAKEPKAKKPAAKKVKSPAKKAAAKPKAAKSPKKPKAKSAAKPKAAKKSPAKKAAAVKKPAVKKASPKKAAAKK